MEFSKDDKKLILYCLDFVNERLEEYAEDLERPVYRIECFSIMEKIEKLCEELRKEL